MATVKKKPAKKAAKAEAPRGTKDEKLQQVSEESPSGWAAVLPGMSPEVYASLEAELPGVDPGATEQINLSELRERIQTQGQDPAEAVREMRGEGQSDASRGLQPAADGDVAVPAVSSGSPSPEPGFVRHDELADIVKGAVTDALKTVMAAQAPGEGGTRDPNMMTTTSRAEQAEQDRLEQEEMDILALSDPIGAQLAEQDRHRPGGNKVEASPQFETNPLSAEDIANMTEDEIDDYNRREQRKLQARKQAQVLRRSEMEGLSRKERLKAVMGQRDPNRVRHADNPLGEREVLVVSRRRVGLGEEGMSDLHERIFVPLSAARRLQDAGAVKVEI